MSEMLEESTVCLLSLVSSPFKDYFLSNDVSMCGYLHVSMVPTETSDPPEWKLQVAVSCPGWAQGA